MRIQDFEVFKAKALSAREPLRKCSAALYSGESAECQTVRLSHRDSNRFSSSLFNNNKRSLYEGLHLYHPPFCSLFVLSVFLTHDRIKRAAHVGGHSAKVLLSVKPSLHFQTLSKIWRNI